MPLPKTSRTHAQPNHRQEVALQRIDLAIAELATILLSCAGTGELAKQAILGTRMAVAPVIAGILSAD